MLSSCEHECIMQAQPVCPSLLFFAGYLLMVGSKKKRAFIYLPEISTTLSPAIGNHSPLFHSLPRNPGPMDKGWLPESHEGVTRGGKKLSDIFTSLYSI